MKAGMAVMTAWAALLAPAAAGAADLQPFVAEYSVKYAAFSVGGSRLELRRDSQPGRWIVESRADASGLARLVASGTLRQTSWIQVDGSRSRPLRFRFDDGMERSKEDVAIDFDWSAGRVTGTAKGEAVDVPTQPELQDPVSMQIATMLALQDGRQPGRQPMIEGTKIKVYDYQLLRSERLDTALGPLDTVVYSSSRQGSDRVTYIWLAPKLGYLSVRLEQQRDGKRLFAMYLQKYRSDG